MAAASTGHWPRESQLDGLDVAPGLSSRAVAARPPSPLGARLAFSRDPRLHGAPWPPHAHQEPRAPPADVDVHDLADTSDSSRSTSPGTARPQSGPRGGSGGVGASEGNPADRGGAQGMLDAPGPGSGAIRGYLEDLDVGAGSDAPADTEREAAYAAAASVVVDLDSGECLSVEEVQRIYEARDLDTGEAHSLLALATLEGVVAYDADAPSVSASALARSSSCIAPPPRTTTSGLSSDVDGGGSTGVCAGASGGASALCAGYLLKRGRRMNAWKERWCRITADGRLQTFSHGPAYGAGTAGGTGAKMSISLGGCVLRLALPDDEASAEWRYLAAAVTAATSAAPSAFDRARASGKAARRLALLSQRLRISGTAMDPCSPSPPSGGVTPSRRFSEPSVSSGSAGGGVRTPPPAAAGRGSVGAPGSGESAAAAASPLYGFVLSWQTPTGAVRGMGKKGALPVYVERTFYCTSAHDLDLWLRSLALFASCQMSLRIGSNYQTSGPSGALGSGGTAPGAAPDAEGDGESAGVSEVSDQHGFLLDGADAASYMAWLSARSQAHPRHDDAGMWHRWLKQAEAAPGGTAAPPVPEALLRGGVPPVLRKRVWLRCSGSDRLLARLPGYYEMQVAKARHNVPAQVSSEVEKDLHRTFPNHPHFSGDDSVGVRALRRVLLAFAHHNPPVGYCQALNYVAGLLLIATAFDEEASFWLLAGIVENLTPDFYSRQMKGITAQQENFNSFVATILPQLAAHIERVGMPLSYVTTNWFMTLFANSLPSETALRVWDVLFFDGPLILSLVGAALMKFGAAQLMAVSTMPEVAEQLTRLGREEWDADALLAAACFKGMDKQSRVVLARMRKQNQRMMAAARKAEWKTDAVAVQLT